jgi:TolC family type I secretion outer membrane protein
MFPSHDQLSFKYSLLCCLLLCSDIGLAGSLACNGDWELPESTILNGEKSLITTLIQTAWQCNPQNLALSEEISAGNARVKQARASLLPNATVSVNYDNTRYKPSNGDYDELKQRSGTLQGTLRVPLFKPQALEALDASLISSTETQLALYETQSELAMTILDSVLNLIALTEDIRVLEGQVTSTKEQVYINERRLEGGLGSITDVAETRLRLRLAESQLKTRHSERELREIELAQLIGKQQLAIGTIMIDKTLPSIAPKEIDEAMDQLMRDNPTLQRAQNSVAYAQANIKVQNRGHWPTVDLVATRSGNRYYKDSGNANNNSTSNSYMLQFELPLYSGGSVSALEAEAQAESRKATQELLSAQNTAIAELRQHYEESELHRQRVAMNEISMSDAKKLLSITLKAFKAGNRSNIDVLNAQQQVTDVGGELIKSRVDYLRAQAQIMKLLGKLLDIPTLQQFDTVLRMDEHYPG